MALELASRDAESFRALTSFAIGLIGRGIGQSSSPLIHEREAAHLGLQLVYRLVDFDHLGLHDDELGATLDFMAGIGFVGVNVTHPFKQAAMALLDELDPTAAELGAVNTVRFVGGRKIGFNTDWSGFCWLLESELPAAQLDRIAQIGAGGAGSATAYALLRSGAGEVSIFDQDSGRAQALVERMKGCFPERRVSYCADAREAVRGATGIVQTTPVGMLSHPGLPIDIDLLDASQWLADAIYFPRETALVQAARARGLRAVGGSAMVVGQAAEAFRLFTGLQPQRRRMADEFHILDVPPDGGSNQRDLFGQARPASSEEF